jgi:hypothetical protein
MTRRSFRAIVLWTIFLSSALRRTSTNTSRAPSSSVRAMAPRMGQPISRHFRTCCAHAVRRTSRSSASARERRSSTTSSLNTPSRSRGSSPTAAPSTKASLPLFRFPSTSMRRIVPSPSYTSLGMVRPRRSTTRKRSPPIRIRVRTPDCNASSSASCRIRGRTSRRRSRMRGRPSSAGTTGST